MTCDYTMMRASLLRHSASSGSYQS